MEDMGNHLQVSHKDEVVGNSLPTLLPWAAVQTMGIKFCPLCSPHGPEDSPELVDHVLRHVLVGTYVNQNMNKANNDRGETVVLIMSEEG